MSLTPSGYISLVGRLRYGLLGLAAIGTLAMAQQQMPKAEVRIEQNQAPVLNSVQANNITITVNQLHDVRGWGHTGQIPLNMTTVRPVDPGSREFALESLLGQLRQDKAFAEVLASFLGITGAVNVSDALGGELDKAVDAGSGLSTMLKSIVKQNGYGSNANAGEARTLMVLAADRGVPGAQFLLQDRYWNGTEGYTKDKRRSTQYLERYVANERVARSTRAEQSYYLGNRYLNAEGVDKDLCKGVMFRAQAADFGYPEGMFATGVERLKEKRCLPNDKKKGLEWIERAAALGHRAAAETAGDIHYQGLAGASDYGAAERHYLASGSTSALRMLGWIYLKGLQRPDGESDYVKAMSFSRAAAEADDAAAMTTVGLLYNYGLGVAQDLNEAARWYSKASDRGHVWATLNLARVVRLGCVDAERMPKWETLLIGLTNRQDIDQPQRARAMFDLGAAYTEGPVTLVTRDLAKGQLLLQDSCKLGDSMACLYVAVNDFAAAKRKTAIPDAPTTAAISPSADASGQKAAINCNEKMGQKSTDPNKFP